MIADEDPEAPACPEPPLWRAIVGTAAGVFLGVIFIVGLYAKAIDPEAFAETVRHEGLDFLLPSAWVAGIGLTLEAVLGFSLLLGLRRLRVLLPSAGLVAFFVFLTGRAYLNWDPHGPLDESTCGCFGNLIQRNPAEAFWQDLVLLVPACLLSFLARPRRAMPHTRTRYAGAIGLSVLVLGFSVLAPGLPLDDLATRLKPGVLVKELCVGENRPAPAPARTEEVEAPPAAGEGRICVDHLIPELAEGEHVIILAALEDEALRMRVPALNAYALDAQTAPILYVVTPASVADIERFEFEQQSAFALVEAPAAVLRPLYRRLPRSFLVRDGRVIRTWSGWPPLDALAAQAEEPGGHDHGR